MTCSNCLKTMNKEEAESPHHDNDKNIMCDECYNYHFQSICPMCQDFFEKATKAEDHFFAITKEVIEYKGIEHENKLIVPGIYRALKWPMFWGNRIFGFNDFFDNTIALVKGIDLDPDIDFLDEICYGCAIQHEET